MIRTKGEPGTGDIIRAVRHMRKIQKQIADTAARRPDELYETAKELQSPMILSSTSMTIRNSPSSTLLPAAWPLRPMRLS